MTLSIMDNHEAIKMALKEYQNNAGEIPKVLERYLEYVARTGKPLFSWDLISCLVVKKFENVIDDFIIEKPVHNTKNNNADNLSTQTLKQECFKALNSLTGVPFTIQRVCELLLSPKKNYSKLEKFLRGFLRVVKVVTTVDRIGQKITTESQSFANAMSPYDINESGDSWTGFTAGHSDESLVHIPILSSPNNNSLIDDYADEKLGQPISVCLPADSMDSYTTKMIEDQQTTSDSLYQHFHHHNHHPNQDEQYFLEQQKQKISMPPIGALLKPMGQLEAFVQNVVSNNQVESTNNNGAVIHDDSLISKKRISLIENAEADDNESGFDNKNSLASSSLSSDNVDTDYSSPAKKRKLDSFSSQDNLISSSDASIERVSMNSPEKQSKQRVAVATMSSQAAICNEEPSSTDEMKDQSMSEENDEDDNNRESIHRPDDSDVVDTHGDNNGIDTEIDANTSDKCETAVTNSVDAGIANSRQSVEADQSNCADYIDYIIEPGERESNCDTNNKDDSNSIDEETGEHV